MITSCSVDLEGKLHIWNDAVCPSAMMPEAVRRSLNCGEHSDFVCVGSGSETPKSPVISLPRMVSVPNTRYMCPIEASDEFILTYFSTSPTLEPSWFPSFMRAKAKWTSDTHGLLRKFSPAQIQGYIQPKKITLVKQSEDDQAKTPNAEEWTWIVAE